MLMPRDAEHVTDEQWLELMRRIGEEDGDPAGLRHRWYDDDGVRYCRQCGIAEAAASGSLCPDPRVPGWRPDGDPWTILLPQHAGGLVVAVREATLSGFIVAADGQVAVIVVADE